MSSFLRWSPYGLWSCSEVLWSVLGPRENQVALDQIGVTLIFWRSLFLKDLMLPCQSVCVKRLNDLPLRSPVTSKFSLPYYIAFLIFWRVHLIRRRLNLRITRCLSIKKILSWILLDCWRVSLCKNVGLSWEHNDNAFQALPSAPLCCVFKYLILEGLRVP